MNYLLFKFVRHPYVLTYIDSLDVEDSLMLVTEQCVPLSQWLNSIYVTSSSAENLVIELTWGKIALFDSLSFKYELFLEI
jgi:hypothetical protein